MSLRPDEHEILSRTKAKPFLRRTADPQVQIPKLKVKPFFHVAEKKPRSLAFDTAVQRFSHNVVDAEEKSKRCNKKRDE